MRSSMHQSTDASESNTAPSAGGMQPRGTSFAETALRLGGKSVDEARRTGVIDTADDQVEEMFASKHQTAASPLHRAIWERKLDTDLFRASQAAMSDAVHVAMNRAVQLVKIRKRSGTLLDDHHKISEETLAALGDTGYWGLLIPKQFGGLESSMVDFTRLLTRMATVEPTVAGLASVHGCIGAVDPLRTFGNDEQKRSFLPSLASGQRLSGFALTEPGAGSDLTALRTTARREGDHYIVNGEKLFITNATTGRTIGLVCLIEGRPAVLVVDLPEFESDAFQLRRYGLHALKHAHNQGLVFRDFHVPAANLLDAGVGDGLTIAYHGLNLGRVSLCANAAGTMRMMLANMLPWGAYRHTYGASIDRRVLVRRRFGEMAGYIVSSDALAAWCATLLDQGYRGEMECIIAKIYGSEVQKRAAIELFMKTHGGRSFLHGHLFGDNVHEFLAPCIYEGEGEVLGMAFFKSLVKAHGKHYFEPIGRVLYEAGIKSPNLMNPMHLWRLRRPMAAYAAWWVGQRLSGRVVNNFGRLPLPLRRYATYAAEFLTSQSFEISAAMRTYQLKLADRQCAMNDLSRRIQDAVVMLVTCLHAATQTDAVTQAAAEVVCNQLWQGLTGMRAGDRDWRKLTELGGAIAQSGWSELDGIDTDSIMMQY